MGVPLEDELALKQESYRGRWMASKADAISVRLQSGRAVTLFSFSVTLVLPAKLSK